MATDVNLGMLSLDDSGRLPVSSQGTDRYSQIMAQMGGGSDPYSRIMGQMPVLQNPYANLSSGLLGGYNPNLYRNAASARMAGLLNMGGGGGGGDYTPTPSDWDNMTNSQKAAYYAENPNMASFTRGLQGLFGNTLYGKAQAYFNPGFVSEQSLLTSLDPVAYQNAKESFRASEINAMNQGYPSVNAMSMQSMQDAYNADMAAAAQAAAQDQASQDTAATNTSSPTAESMTSMQDAMNADTAAANAGSSDTSSSKIVCTAMNQEYGFGSFRNAIWLKYSESKLTKAHEVGYHALFLPLVDFGFKQGDGKVNLMVRKFLESCARHRSLDLRAEMRGTKRDPIGRAYRFVLEPLCYAVGKFKGY